MLILYIVIKYDDDDDGGGGGGGGGGACREGDLDEKYWSESNSYS